MSLYNSLSDVVMLVGNNMIYIQILLLIVLAITSVNVYNPLNKTMLIISFGLLSTIVAKAVIQLILDTLTDVSYRAMNGFDDFIEMAKVSYDNAQYRLVRNTDKEMLMAFVIVLACVTVYCIKLTIFYRKEKKIYIIPKSPKMKDTFIEEKMMSNSTFEVAQNMPNFQASVLASLDGITYHMMGQCFWVDEGLITAAHVIDGFEYLCIYKDDERKINVLSDRFVIGDGDYAICREATDITTKLGLSKAKLSRCAVQKNSGLSANVIALGRRSIGFLDEHPQFGYVTYTGSTIKGFSGAPYYFGKTIFGMHLGSDSGNLGYDGAFLRSEIKPSRVIKRTVGLDQEDSAEWLYDQFEKYGEEITYSRSPFDPDEYKVKVGGQYHIVSAEVMHDVLDARKKKTRPGKLKKMGGGTRNKKKNKKSKHSYARENASEDSSSESDEVEVAPRSADPEVAVVQGLLSEWGKTSIYKPTPKVEDVPSTNRTAVTFKDYKKESADFGDELPLAPREANNYKESGNLLRAPAAVAGAPGMAYLPPHVQNQNMQTLPQTACTYQPPLVNYHMESQRWMPVPPNAVSKSTVRNKRRKSQRQKEKSELEQYYQLYGPIKRGDATLHQHQTPTGGST
nr:hypothetical protein [Vespula vulgaris Sobemo-like virus 1]